jgi:hypothetical protein
VKIEISESRLVKILERWPVIDTELLKVEWRGIDNIVFEYKNWGTIGTNIQKFQTMLYGEGYPTIGEDLQEIFKKLDRQLDFEEQMSDIINED